MRTRKALLTVAVAGLLAACGSPAATSSTTTPTPNEKPTPDAAAVAKVAEAVYPTLGNGYGVCGINGDYSACPLTERLKARVNPPGPTLCFNCQNVSLTRQIDVHQTSTGPIARVSMFNGLSTYDLVLVQSNGSWLVDDVYGACSGGTPSAANSIYRTPLTC